MTQYYVGSLVSGSFVFLTKATEDSNEATRITFAVEKKAKIKNGTINNHAFPSLELAEVFRASAIGENNIGFNTPPANLGNYSGSVSELQRKHNVKMGAN
jgi:hypothetical protein